LALIVDEVFLDYGFVNDEERVRSFAAPNSNSALTFILSGLSKIAGLPQMKAAWIVCNGPEVIRSEAQNRLEMIADTFLSMNAPIQSALPKWLAGRHEIQRQIQERTAANLVALDQLLATQQAVSRLHLEAGWYAVLRIPALRPDEETALHLLNVGVWTHPGSYFGFPAAGWLVISLLTHCGEFSTGVNRLIATLFH
jgi:aspartate/methionine/tyrosine aminotransferase